MSVCIKEVTESVFVNADEVSSMEFIPASADEYYSQTQGTLILLKNGRKIFVNYMKPSEVMEKLK